MTWSGYLIAMRSHAKAVPSFPVSEFKAKCIAILKRVRRTGEPIAVTLRGRPLVSIRSSKEDLGERHLGGQQGVAKVRGDIVHVDSTSDWESLKA